MTLLEKLIQMGYSQKESFGLIMSGNVLVNNEKTTLSSTIIKNNDVIRIKEYKKWVSRGALKLIEALNKFKINIENKICLDVGSSTGGFTEVLLDRGAKKVYALDVGTNQLDYKLRINPKVKVYEQTNLKNINAGMFNEEIDFVCCDVSFISATKLLEVISKEKILKSNNEIVVLIKPQFEAKSFQVSKGGFVEKKFHQEIINNFVNYANDNNFTTINIIESPIKGNKSKNIEYLAFFKFKGEENGTN